MSAAAVLRHLETAGIHLEVSGDNLLATPRAALTDETRALIRAHKPALLALLTNPAPPPLPPDDLEAIQERLEERAAIIEFDAHQPRPLAEAQAQAGMRCYRILVAMGAGKTARWVTLLAPGCDLAEAIRITQGQFGAARVADVRPQELS